MKKRLTALLTIICCAVFFTLTACGNNKTEQDFGVLYSYSFNANGGTPVDGGTLYRNDCIPVPQTPSRDGYEFTGWYADSACTERVDFAHPVYRMPAHDVEFYAGWQQLVSISFNVNGGTAVNKIEGHAGATIPADVINSVITTKAGSIFDGWYSDALCTVPFIFGYIPNNSITVHAKWHSANGSVSVTFVNGNQTVKTYTDCTEGELLGAITEGESFMTQPDKEYARFVGWATDAEGYGLINENYKIPADNVTLYAVYRQKQGWAHITVAETDYTEAADFYAEKGKVISSDVSSESNIIKANVLTHYKLTYDYFLDAHGAKFDFKNDVVTGDMELRPELYSEDLTVSIVFDSDNTTPLYVKVTGYTDNGADRVVIPSTCFIDDASNGIYGFYHVSEIEKNVFKGATFSELTIGDSVEIIKESAFENCVNLTEVTFPESLVEIYDSAFAGCTQLSNVNINNGVYYFGYRVFKDTAFETSLFANNNGAVYISDLNNDIESDTLYYYNGEFSENSVITIGRAGLMSIAGGAFEGKRNITNLNIAGNVYLVGDAAFKDCHDLKSVTLGSNVQYLRASVFKGCENLKTIDQTNNERLRYVGESAFENCTSLTSFVIGRNLTTLGEAAFRGCTSLSEVSVYIGIQEINGQNYYVMSALTAVPAYAFYGCTSLKELAFMNAVKSVGESAFEGCSSLVSVTLGFNTNCNIASIGDNAFKGCSSLKVVMICKSAANANGCTKVSATALTGADNAKILVFASFLNVYKAALTDYTSKIMAYDVTAPKITDKSTESEQISVKIAPNDSYDVMNGVNEKYTITDFVDGKDDYYYTVDADLKFTVTVQLGENTLSPKEENGTVYDFSQEGVYTVTVRVTDECGYYSTATFDITVKTELI